MLDICANADAALLELAVSRGHIDGRTAAAVRRNRRGRSAAVALVEDGHLSTQVVRALRSEQRRHSIDHAIDGYQLLGRLGAGGMSEVFRAQDLINRRVVAIKVIAPRVAGDRLFIERFQREARAAAALIHPNIIACHGMGETRGKPYMVLEYMEGGDVEMLAARARWRLPEERVLRIGLDCARGLVAVGSHGMVHRDIKPANIFLDGDGLAKLADLGLAKSAAQDDQLTVAGVRVGSPGYMAPEQARGEAVDIRSDIYSLGASLYHLLAGRAAFVGRTPLETVLKGLREEPEPLASAAPQVSPAVAAIVTRCLARLPRDRYQDPAELEHDLGRASGGPTAEIHSTRSPRPRAVPTGVRRFARALTSRLATWCRRRMEGLTTGDAVRASEH